MIDWPRFVELVRGHQRFLLTAHVRPDCDALGSELAMAGILEQLGKDVWIVNAFRRAAELAVSRSRRKAASNWASTSRPNSCTTARRSWCWTPRRGCNWAPWRR